ncbi:MAG: ATP-binding protein [Candidatus Thorarchaeota archaeon]|jgi:NAD-dependent dihydropyrimidine dehydrogenase PreA subunit
MSASAWERLAAVLDKIPNSYTHVDDGSHIKVLQWIFTEEEADLTSRMKLRGETAEELGERLDKNPEELKSLLEVMAEKGQIRAWNSSTGRRYALIPWAVGIYEEQLERMDSEFAGLAEDYFLKGKGGGLFDNEPAIFKVIPVNSVVKSELEIKPYQVAENLINNAKAWGIRECICKKQQDLLEKPCSYPTSVCITFAKKENAFDNSHLDQAITKEEALLKLKEAEEAGLVHCTMNIQEGHNYICNCCTCCCNILRGVSLSDQPHAYVKSDFIMSVDEDLCSGCETCIERCQFDALSIPEDIIAIDNERCIGCGVCAITCPEGALSLIPREGDKKEPPEKFMDWMTQKAISRGVDPSDLM